jgi:hypothetical protein
MKNFIIVFNSTSILQIVRWTILVKGQEEGQTIPPPVIKGWSNPVK